MLIFIECRDDRRKGILLVEHCQDLNCSTEYRPVCASNFQNYSNECQMKKSACQLDQNLTKLHDGLCTLEEQQRLHEGQRGNARRG